MTPVIYSVPPSHVTVYQFVHPSVNLSLPPSIHPSHRQASDWSSQGYFLHLHPSAGKEQEMKTDNTRAKEYTHARVHAHTYSVPTRLLVGFATSCICILGSRRMHMQMQTMLIVIKGHLLPPLHSLFFSLVTSLSLTPCLSLALTASPNHASTHLPHTLSLGALSQAAE